MSHWWKGPCWLCGQEVHAQNCVFWSPTFKVVHEFFPFAKGWNAFYHRNNRIQKKWRRNGGKRGPDFLRLTSGTITFSQIHIPGLLTRDIDKEDTNP